MSGDVAALAPVPAEAAPAKQESRQEPWAASVVAEPAKVLSNAEVNAEYRHLVVACSEVSARAVPGQFFQLLCPATGGEQPFLRRPMSLYGVDPQRQQGEFLYKAAGAGTRALAGPKPTD